MGVHVRIYTFLAELEAGWRQAGGRLEGVHVRIYTFLAKLEAGWRQAGGRQVSFF